MKKFIGKLKKQDITPKEAEEIYTKIKNEEEAREWMSAVLDVLKSGRSGNFISSFPASDQRYESAILQVRELISLKDVILGAVVVNVDLKHANAPGSKIISGSEDGFAYREIVSDRFGIIDAMLEKSFPGYFSKTLLYKSSDFCVRNTGKKSNFMESLPLENISMLSFVDIGKLKFLWHIGIPIVALRSDFSFINPSFGSPYEHRYEHFKIPDNKLTQKVLYGISCNDIIKAAKGYGIDTPRLKDVPEMLFTMLYKERLTEESDDDSWIDITR